MDRLSAEPQSLAEKNRSDDASKYSKETSTLEDSSELQAEKQSIIEVQNGQSLDGQPIQPGPQYKRGRGRSFFKEPPRKGVACQVPGCDRPLHKLRDYYKRYKICPYHLELNCMVVEGQSIRFCQQCGRFQLLDEFDGDRRSCRRKLEKHNERRRKLEGATDSDSEEGANRSAGKIRRNGSNSSRMWGSRSSPHLQSRIEVAQMLQNLANDTYFMQDIDPSLAGGLRDLTEEPWNDPRSSPGALPESQQLHPGLLAALAAVTPSSGPSSPTAPLKALGSSEEYLTDVLRPEPTVSGGLSAEALRQILEESGVGLAPDPLQIKSEPIPIGQNGSAFAPVSNTNDAMTTVTSTEMSRPPDVLVHALQTQNHHQQQQHPRPPFHPQAASLALSGGLGDTPEAPVVSQLLTLLNQLRGTKEAPQGPSNEEVVAISLKLFKTTPANLHPSLLKELTSWMAKTPTYGELAMRPGCVHFSSSVLCTESERSWIENDISSSMRRVFASTSLGIRESRASDAALLQLHSTQPKAAIMIDGEIRMLLDLSNDTPSAHLPSVALPLAVKPLAVTSGYTGSFLVLAEGMANGHGAQDHIYCKSQSGRYADVEVLGRGSAILPQTTSKASISTEKGSPTINARYRQTEELTLTPQPSIHRMGLSGGWFHIAVPRLTAGSYALELARGSLVSSPLAFLVLDDEDAVKEVCQLGSDPSGVLDIPSFIQKLGIMVKFRKEIQSESIQYIPDDTKIRVHEVAGDIAAVCLSRGWSAVLKFVLPVLTATAFGASATESLEGVSAMFRASFSGLSYSPLCAAVLSGNEQVIRVLGTWAAEHRVSLWDVENNTAPGFNLSCLHLVAMLHAPCTIATALMDCVVGTAGMWEASHVIDNSDTNTSLAIPSPLSIAISLGQAELIQLLANRGVVGAQHAALATHKKDCAQVPFSSSSSSSCCCSPSHTDSNHQIAAGSGIVTVDDYTPPPALPPAIASTSATLHDAICRAHGDDEKETTDVSACDHPDQQQQQEEQKVRSSSSSSRRSRAQTTVVATGGWSIQYGMQMACVFVMTLLLSARYALAATRITVFCTGKKSSVV